MVIKFIYFLVSVEFEKVYYVRFLINKTFKIVESALKVEKEGISQNIAFRIDVF